MTNDAVVSDRALHGSHMCACVGVCVTACLALEPPTDEQDSAAALTCTRPCSWDRDTGCSASTPRDARLERERVKENERRVCDTSSRDSAQRRTACVWSAVCVCVCASGVPHTHSRHSCKTTHAICPRECVCVREKKLQRRQQRKHSFTRGHLLQQ